MVFILPTIDVWVTSQYLNLLLETKIKLWVSRKWHTTLLGLESPECLHRIIIRNCSTVPTLQNDHSVDFILCNSRKHLLKALRIIRLWYHAFIAHCMLLYTFRKCIMTNPIIYLKNYYFYFPQIIFHNVSFLLENFCLYKKSLML